jgi:hypothetical protein
MQREIEYDGRSEASVSTRRPDEAVDQKLWKAWQGEISTELSHILERLEAFELSLPAFHVESAIAAIRKAKP